MSKRHTWVFYDLTSGLINKIQKSSQPADFFDLEPNQGILDADDEYTDYKVEYVQGNQIVSRPTIGDDFVDVLFTNEPSTVQIPYDAQVYVDSELVTLPVTFTEPGRHHIRISGATYVTVDQEIEVVWSAKDARQIEKTELDKAKATIIAFSNWTQVMDSGLSQEATQAWADYRAQVRGCLTHPALDLIVEPV